MSVYINYLSNVGFFIAISFYQGKHYLYFYTMGIAQIDNSQNAKWHPILLHISLIKKSKMVILNWKQVAFVKKKYPTTKHTQGQSQSFTECPK